MILFRIKAKAPDNAVRCFLFSKRILCVDRADAFQLCDNVPHVRTHLFAVAVKAL